MLYEALSQPKVLLFLILSGFFAGFLFEFKNIFFKKIIKNRFFKHLFDFFLHFFVFFCYFFTNLLTNHGEIRFFGIIVFLLALSVQRFISTNLVAKRLPKCYNKAKEKRRERKKT